MPARNNTSPKPRGERAQRKTRSTTQAKPRTQRKPLAAEPEKKPEEKEKTAEKMSPVRKVFNDASQLLVTVAAILIAALQVYSLLEGAQMSQDFQVFSRVQTEMAEALKAQSPPTEPMAAPEVAAPGMTTQTFPVPEAPSRTPQVPSMTPMPGGQLNAAQRPAIEPPAVPDPTVTMWDRGASENELTPGEQVLVCADFFRDDVGIGNGPNGTRALELLSAIEQRAHRILQDR